MKCFVCVSTVAMVAAVAVAGEIATVELESNAGTKTISVPLEIKDGKCKWSMNADEIGDGTRSVKVRVPFAKANAGEPGYWVLPDNTLGKFAMGRSGVRRLDASMMGFWGMKMPRHTFIARISGMRNDYQVFVVATNGTYEVITKFMTNCRHPYEDPSIEWTFLGAKDGYPQMAKAYRDYQLATGTVKPLSERVREQPELEYAAKSVEVRIRQAWKPAPPPIHEQTLDNEPPMHVAVTFDRAGEFVDACKKAGVGKTEFCLVGWNRKGHDGRYPQIFPVEPELGGEEKLRSLIKRTQEKGYLIVCHNNHGDAYTVSECWDANDIIRDANGALSSNACWSGGRMYNICPKVSWEKYASHDLKKIADLGFRGLHYIDVQSIVNPRCCDNPLHPINRKEAAGYLDKIAAEAKRLMGGFASEGGFDNHIGNLDFALYVSFAYPRGTSFANKDGKFPPLTDMMVPLWQLVYNGIVLSNPFSACCNYPVKDADKRLTLVEYGGRPMFYIHSAFVTGMNWMGTEDLSLADEDSLKRAVAAIKRGTDEYAQLSDLQFVYMTDHRFLDSEVTLTGYANGSEVVVNHSNRPFEYKGKLVPAMDWRRFDGDMAEAIGIDRGRQLFVDDYLIAATNGITRHWNKPIKSEDPVVWPGGGAGTAARKPGETPANLTCATDGGLWWDPVLRKYRLWYQADWIGDICYAESTDGIKWEYPDLGIDKGTNRLFEHDVIDSWCVVPNYAADNPYSDWKLYVSEPGGATDDRIWESKDGTHFNALGVIGRSGDRSTMYYDPFLGKWVFSLRHYRDVVGRCRRFFASTEFGGSGCKWEWNGDSHLEEWLVATNGVRRQLYSFNAVAYESLMLGVMEILYNTPGDNGDCAVVGLPKQTGLHFCFSRDGRTYEPRADADIGPSGWGSGKWDTGYLSEIGGICVIRDERLWFYYSALRGDRRRSAFEGDDWHKNGMYSNGAIGMASLRRDGFAGMVADGEGQLLTKPLLFSGAHLFVNAECRFGDVAVEVADCSGKVLPGFARDDCRMLANADSTKAEIRWQNANLSSLAGKPVRFRFHVNCGTLYSFWVSRSAEGESGGYVAAGGPDYVGLRDEIRQRRK